ncbi:reverse transcriptase-like protein [Sporosarcina aquimarina]|uniref:reverse transcriptase-like protein n=1 Tax=Sporosarcina aquimarina TaxID=114975 RepID=UPI001C8EC22B|nr:reverse transcriptase-like protein [Sporosarcina aquimarina]MBY0224009.1 reverse transcriptase-like protein [Sporosarcina aquimarina]
MKVLIEWTYRSPKGTETVFKSEEMPAAQALLIANDLEKTGRAKQLVFIDQFDSSWTVKELKGYLKGIETEPHNIIVYFDGGFNWESKAAGLGCVIYYDQNGKSYRLRKNASVDGLTSNNEAEYAALHLCLQELEFLGIQRLPVQIIGDSRVVINHMSEEWPVIEQDLYSWADKIEAKMKSLELQPQYELVSRKANGEADRLAAQALAGIEIIATSEMV